MERAATYRWFELGLLLTLGLANVASEYVSGLKAAVVVLGVILWVGYAVRRWLGEPAVLRRWGFRTDTAGAAAKAALALTLPTVVAATAWGLHTGSFPPPRGFWLILALYPAWGVAQQLLLNAMLARNLEGLLPPWAVVPVAGALFAASHAPDLPVVALTFPAGLAWVWIYRRWPNLWVQGVAHGIIGTVVFYGVLGRDPLAALLG